MQEQLRAMDEADGADEKDAAEVDHDYNFRLLSAESLERHRAAACPNCACWTDAVPQQTFNEALKRLFVLILILSVLSNFSLLLNEKAAWLLYPIVTNWKMSVLFVVFVAVIYLVAVLRNQKERSGSALQRKEQVPTISASIQQV